MQMEDYKIVDQNFEKMSESLDKVAEKHLIELQEDDSGNQQVDKMREAVDYTMVMNIGMLFRLMMVWMIGLVLQLIRWKILKQKMLSIVIMITRLQL